MSSKSEQVTAKCDRCDQLFSVTHWYKIDGSDNPELKQRILDGSLFAAKCDHCGALFKLEQSIRYSEMFHRDRQPFAAYLVRAQDIEKQRDYIEMMPLFRRMGARIHVVNSEEELRQLIRTYDAGGLPPETVVRSSRDPRKHQQHEDKLDAKAASMDKFLSEVASGKPSPETMDRIVRGMKRMKRMKQKEQNKQFVAEIFKDPKQSCIVLGALGCLLAVLIDLPEGFYVALRFIMVAASASAIWLIQKSSHEDYFKTIMSLLLGILAIVFNPIMPIEMEQESWTYFNLAGAVLLLGMLFAARKKHNAAASVDNQPIIPTPLQPPAVRSGTAPIPSRQEVPKQKEEKGEVFYYVLEFPPEGTKPTLANTLIPATASIERKEDGGRTYHLGVNDGAKVHHVLEAQAAVYWKSEIDDGRVTKEQAVAWIDKLSQATAKEHWGKLNSDAEKTSETHLLVPLAKATVYYTFTNAEDLGVPASFVQLTRQGAATSAECRSIIANADAMDAARKLGLIDPAFIKHLDRCFRRN
jgi:hypothetical protein